MKNMASRKGFTLVELIVVLAIMTVLASMLAPSLTGYIDKANDRKLVAKARSLYNASQSTVSSQYATNSSFEQTTDYFEYSGMNNEIIKLSEVEGDFECYIALDSAYRVTELFYKENDKSAYLKDGKCEVAKNVSKPSSTSITIKGDSIKFPGSKYTELASTLKDATDDDIKLLLSVEEMQKEAIKIYQEYGRTGKYAFSVKFNKDTGKAYFSKIMMLNLSLTSPSNSNTAVNCGGFYLIVIDGNTITTNIKVEESQPKGNNKIRINPATLNIDERNNVYTYAGFNEPEVYK